LEKRGPVFVAGGVGPVNYGAIGQTEPRPLILENGVEASSSDIDGQTVGGILDGVSGLVGVGARRREYS
jgi:hypothetical protein